jgi:hypothetical protein
MNRSGLFAKRLKAGLVASVAGYVDGAVREAEDLFHSGQEAHEPIAGV